jgi:hypothetical protein
MRKRSFPVFLTLSVLLSFKGVISRAWIFALVDNCQIPAGPDAPLADQHISIALCPNKTSEFEIIEYIFPAGELSGVGAVGASLTDSITGQNFSREETAF